jgi:hypothetical protein
MSVQSLNRVDSVPAISCPGWTAPWPCIVRLVRKAAVSIYHALAFDADAIFESRDWPYLWKTK